MEQDGVRELISNIVSLSRYRHQRDPREEQTGAGFIKVGMVSPDLFFAAIAEGGRG